VNPAWSVVVPTYNRPPQLARCLVALADLRPPAGGYEVIIINDGGVDVHHIVAASSVTNIRLLSQANAGPGAARNHGARAALGSWLAFTDDDCEPDRNWLRVFERTLLARPGALVGGTVVNSLVDNVYAETSQQLAGFVERWFDGVAKERFFTSNNIAAARSAFLESGGFDESFGTLAGEDREFCERWFAQGRLTISAPDARVRHSHMLTLRSFLRQHFTYGRGAAAFRRVRSSEGRAVRIDPGFYIASLRHAAGVKPVTRGTALAAFTLAAHAAYAAGLARESLKSRGFTEK
jgi:glycosyltransferase involved in cell wall biosynthesis